METNAEITQKSREKRLHGKDKKASTTTETLGHTRNQL